MDVKSIDLFVTEQCNLSCKYCFHPKLTNDVISVEMGKQILDNLKEKYPSEMYINFFGGEPMLYPEIIKDLSEHAKTLWKKLKLGMSTNGTIYNEEFFSWAKDNNFKMQVSCDGNKATQNAVRGMAEEVHKNIKLLVKLFPKMCVRMTYTPHNVSNLADNIVFIHHLGIKSIIHQALIEADWSEEALNAYQEQYKLILHYKRKIKNDLYIVFLDRNVSICDFNTMPDEAFCQAGKSLIAILPNADVYPCHRAASNRLFKLGNIIENEVIRGEFLNITKNKIGCKSCPARSTCHNCIITSFLVNKSLNKPIEKYCKLMNIEHEGAIWGSSILKKDMEQSLLISISNVIMDMSKKLDALEERIKNGMSKL